jgi:hypothetical protein
MFTRHCALEGCEVVFQTDHPTKKHCCAKHSTLGRVRRWKAKHRKGGGDGGGNGGGSGPTLFDELVPVDPKAIVLTDPRYRTPPVPEKHPPERVRQARRRAA